MTKIEDVLRINLQLFDDGATVGAASAAGGTETGGTTAAADTQGTSEPSQQTETGDIEGSAAESQAQTDTDPAKVLAQRKKDFEKYLKDNKDLDTERVQKIINKRFKETQQYEDYFKAIEPLMRALADDYGTDEPMQMYNKYINEDARIEKKAFLAGKDPETFRMEQAIDLAQKNAEQKDKELRDYIAMVNSVQLEQDWREEAEKMKPDFPEFDLDTEHANNPLFADLLKVFANHGHGVQSAYKAAHFAELLQKETERIAKETEERVTKTIQARGTRPVENGISGADVGTPIKKVTDFTPELRAEIAKAYLENPQKAAQKYGHLFKPK